MGLDSFGDEFYTAHPELSRLNLGEECSMTIDLSPGCGDLNAYFSGYVSGLKRRGFEIVERTRKGWEVCLKVRRQKNA